MTCWLTAVIFLSVLGLTNQDARFIRLPSGYFLGYLSEAVRPSDDGTPSSMRDCMIRATIEELTTRNVSYYTFQALNASFGFCRIYRTFVSVLFADAGASVRTKVDAYEWFMKIPNEVDYQHSCAKPDIMRLLRELNNSYDATAPSKTTLSPSSNATMSQVTVNTTTAQSSTEEAPTTTAALTATEKPTATTTAFSSTTSPKTTASTSNPTKSAATTTTRKPCKPKNAAQEAGVFIDPSPPLLLDSLGDPPIDNCKCTRLLKHFWASGTAVNPTTTWDVTNAIRVSCNGTGANLSALCIVDENGVEWSPGAVPPDFIEMYPFCENPQGCHMYAAHYTFKFINMKTDMVHGNLGSELRSIGGNIINEARKFRNPTGKEVGYQLRNLGYSSTYIKAAAISCVGCASVRIIDDTDCYMK